MNESGACIVRRDRTILLECGHQNFEAARKELAAYAELIKSPPAYHTYRITPLSLWNAASLHYTAERIIAGLHQIARWGVPAGLVEEIEALVSRHGKLSLHGQEPGSEKVSLRSAAPELMDVLSHEPSLKLLGLQRIDKLECSFRAENRGLLKQELMRLGYPVLDYAGYHAGQSLSLSWKHKSESDMKDESFGLRDYQLEAVQLFKGTEGQGGSGVVVLPCGAGKTIIGLAVLENLQCETLILTSNTTSVRQWKEELLQRTSLLGEAIGEYSGDKREVRPVTIATYQILTHRSSKNGAFVHMKLFQERNWGLIIYDEVHLLPAPVFRATADIQATRRLGLTATLVREDGKEGDVFSLIGPKRYDLPWKELEQQGWIAEVECIEMIVPMNSELRQRYLYATAKEKFRLASCNPAKMETVSKLLNVHSGSSVLIIGQYLDQLTELAKRIDAPLITGTTKQQVRDELYTAFNEGIIQVLVVSKVANFAVNLPDASIAIEISGAFGSRQEEAQRLGRILRPKKGENKAYFYTLVSENSREQDFATRRRMFLTEQGYEYVVKMPLREGESIK